MDDFGFIHTHTVVRTYADAFAVHRNAPSEVTYHAAAETHIMHGIYLFVMAEKLIIVLIILCVRVLRTRCAVRVLRTRCETSLSRIQKQ